MENQVTERRDSSSTGSSIDEHRAWQARLIFERTTVDDRIAMIEGMLNELGDERIQEAIDRKLAARERTFTPPPANDR